YDVVDASGREQREAARGFIEMIDGAQRAFTRNEMQVPFEDFAAAHVDANAALRLGQVVFAGELRGAPLPGEHHDVGACEQPQSILLVSWKEGLGRLGEALQALS